MSRLLRYSVPILLAAMATMVGPVEADEACEDIVFASEDPSGPPLDSITSLGVGDRQLALQYSQNVVVAGSNQLIGIAGVFKTEFVDVEDASPLPVSRVEFQLDPATSPDVVAKAFDSNDAVVRTVTTSGITSVVLEGKTPNQIARIEITATSGTYLLSDLKVCLETDQTVIQAIEELILLVAEFNFARGIENSLDAKLDNALKLLDDMKDQNDGAAFNSIEAFINAVEAQRGKKITDEEADQLISLATFVLDFML